MGGPLTILVVEDDPDLRHLYRLRLDEEHEVQAVGNGDAAIDRALAVDPQVVLLDRDLPGRNGDAVARRHRAEGIDAPIGMITGTDPDPGIATLPIDEYVTKPLDGSAFDALLERLRARRQAPPELSDYFAMLTRRARLDAALDAARLADSDRVQELNQCIEEQRREVRQETSRRRLETLADTCLPPAVTFPVAEPSVE